MRWITRVDGGPRRVNHVAVPVGHKVYSFGGYCTTENTREYTSMDVHVLNTTTLRWTKHPVSNFPYIENDDIMPYKRYGHTAVVYKDNIYIWGGRNDQEACAVLFCFDTTWHCWTAPPTTGTIPKARDGHTAVIWRNYMCVFGGYEGECDCYASTLHMLDLDKMSWKRIGTEGPEPSVRDFHCAVVIDDKMYVFGGRGTKSPLSLYIPGQEVYTNELWCFDFETFTWHNIRTFGEKPIGRRSHSAFVYKDKMYIFGGYNSITTEHYNDLHEYDPTTLRWRSLTPYGIPPCSRRRQTCSVVNSRVYFFGGTSPVLSPPRQYQQMEDYDELLTDHGDVHVLDFCASLKTLCALAVKQYNLDVSTLPSSIRLEIHNMFSPNKLALMRPNKSKG